MDNIRLAIEDLLLQVDQFPSRASVDNVSNDSAAISSLFPQINASTFEIYKYLEEASIINSKKKPMCKNSLLTSEAWYIISYYNNRASALLSYFRCVDNLNTVKKIVTYHLRYSLLYTLSYKHKCSIKKVLDMYSKNIKAEVSSGKFVSFINSVAVTNLKKEFLSKDLLNPYFDLTKSDISSQIKSIPVKNFAIKNSTETNNI